MFIATEKLLELDRLHGFRLEAKDPLLWKIAGTIDAAKDNDLFKDEFNNAIVALFLLAQSRGATLEEIRTRTLDAAEYQFEDTEVSIGGYLNDWQY